MLTTAELIRQGTEHLKTIAPEYPSWKVDEMEFDPASRSWVLTFIGALPDAAPQPDTLWDILKPRRVVKVVRLDAEDGSLLAVKNQAA